MPGPDQVGEWAHAEVTYHTSDTYRDLYESSQTPIGRDSELTTETVSRKSLQDVLKADLETDAPAGVIGAVERTSTPETNELAPTLTFKGELRETVDQIDEVLRTVGVESSEEHQYQDQYYQAMSHLDTAISNMADRNVAARLEDHFSYARNVHANMRQGLASSNETIGSSSRTAGESISAPIGRIDERTALSETDATVIIDSISSTCSQLSESLQTTIDYDKQLRSFGNRGLSELKSQLDGEFASLSRMGAPTEELQQIIRQLDGDIFDLHHYVELANKAEEQRVNAYTNAEPAMTGHLKGVLERFGQSAAKLKK